MSDKVIVETLEEGIVQVRLARMPVNALNPQFLNDIAEAFTGLTSDGNARAVILTGTGKALSAGMDLKEAMSFDREQQARMVNALNHCYATLYGFPKPLIVAANGHAIAGGLFFVLAGDYRMVNERAMLGLTEVRVGVSFPVVAIALACHELGSSGARRIMLSGQNVTAAQALTIGFIDEAVAADDIASRALAAARQYAAIPPKAYSAVKAQMRAATVQAYQAALGNGDPLAAGWFTDETVAAARAILDDARS